MEPVEIIRKYRSALQENRLFRWVDYLSDREFYDPVYHKCRICGQKVGSRYIGSHFRQTDTKLSEHQKVVKAYEDRCKRFLEAVLAENGFKLNPNPTHYHDRIWETARISVRSTLYSWKNDAILEA